MTTMTIPIVLAGDVATPEIHGTDRPGRSDEGPEFAEHLRRAGAEPETTAAGRRAGGRRVDDGEAARRRRETRRNDEEGKTRRIDERLPADEAGLAAQGGRTERPGQPDRSEQRDRVERSDGPTDGGVKTKAEATGASPAKAAEPTLTTEGPADEAQTGKKLVGMTGEAAEVAEALAKTVETTGTGGAADLKTAMAVMAGAPTAADGRTTGGKIDPTTAETTGTTETTGTKGVDGLAAATEAGKGVPGRAETAGRETGGPNTGADPDQPAAANRMSAIGQATETAGPATAMGAGQSPEGSSDSSGPTGRTTKERDAQTATPIATMEGAEPSQMKPGQSPDGTADRAGSAGRSPEAEPRSLKMGGRSGQPEQAQSDGQGGAEATGGQPSPTGSESGTQSQASTATQFQARVDGKAPGADPATEDRSSPTTTATDAANAPEGSVQNQTQVGRPAGQTPQATGADQARTVQGGSRTQAQRLNSSDVIQQIVSRTSLHGTSRGGEVRIQLKPDYLGPLSLRVALEGGAVTAHLVTQSQSVKEAIEAGLPQLQQALADQGLRTDNIAVTLGSDSFSAQLNGQGQGTWGRRAWDGSGWKGYPTTMMARAADGAYDQSRSIGGSQTTRHGGGHSLDYVA